VWRYVWRPVVRGGVSVGVCRYVRCVCEGVCVRCVVV